MDAALIEHGQVSFTPAGVKVTCVRCGVPQAPELMLKRSDTCKACWRAYMRFRRYGISGEEYAALAEKQGNVCAICGGHNIVLKKNGRHVNGLAVDHVREGRSHRVRGLLCGKCNRGLGFFQDNPALLNKAARYLVGWKC